MRITVVGVGYVGLITAACLADSGNQVRCVDKDEGKIKKLSNGEMPIYEPGLEDLVRLNLKKGSMEFTTDLGLALESSEIIFIAVGTPSGEDGNADLKHVLSVASEIGHKLYYNETIIIIKSTVPVGVSTLVKDIIREKLKLRGVCADFSVISNPEFLKEGNAIADFMKPDRIVLGGDNNESLEKVKALYRPFAKNHSKFIVMDNLSAEMTKYASNAMLATKISFINEMACICEKVGADINMIRLGIGSDSRIGYDFIYPGIGYGGSCFPKDVRALIQIAEASQHESRLLKSVESINNNQKRKLVDKVIQRFGRDLKGMTFALWGLSFKPGTDDIREAPSIITIDELIQLGASIQAYDPVANDITKRSHYMTEQKISFYDSKYAAVNQADALLIVTEWKEFSSPNFNLIKNLLKYPVIFDGRNQYDSNLLGSMEIEYYQIGRS